MKKIYLSIMAAVMLALAACTNEQGMTEYQRVANDFTTMLGGRIDAAHLWKGSVTLNVNIITERATEVMVYSSEREDVLLYDRTVVYNDTIARLTVPQGYGNKITLVYSNGIKRSSKTVTLTGTPEQSVDISFETETAVASKATSRISESSSLYGTDIQKSIGYTNINVTEAKNAIKIVAEGVNASTRNIEVNYELISNGPFEVSMLYGYSGCYTPCVLGYYYHSMGTYSDMKFVDLLDTHSYDYIDGKSKVQYQLDDNTDVWYDTNYDYRDGYDPPYTSVVERLDDNIYNIQHVISKYGSRITNLRGLTYKIDVPTGKHIGFYLRRIGIANNTQRTSMINKGIPSSVLAKEWDETNFSAMVLNCDAKLRSFYMTNNGNTYMGMEDAGTNGDFDCNDVIFGVEAELEIYKPTVAEPDIDGIITDFTNLPWTIAYEDIGRNADFDFNDAVIRIVPDYENETMEVYACAAGCEQEITLWYDGPNGPEELGELHDKLGGGNYINTTSTITVVEPRIIATVAWPNTYSIANDANRFYCMVHRGCCDEMICLNTNKGKTPQALCIPGQWKWPKEGISINTVYSTFSDWGKDLTKTAYWNWYSYPKSDVYVTE